MNELLVIPLYALCTYGLIYYAQVRPTETIKHIKEINRRVRQRQRRALQRVRRRTRILTNKQRLYFWLAGYGLVTATIVLPLTNMSGLISQASITLFILWSQSLYSIVCTIIIIYEGMMDFKQ